MMLLLVAFDSTILHQLATTTLNKELDANLYGSVIDISEYVEESGINTNDFKALENAKKILLNDDTDKVLYSVSDSDGNLLSGNKELLEKTSKNKQQTLKPYFFFTTIDLDKFRVVHSTFTFRNGTIQRKINIQVAVTLNRRNSLSNKILVGVVVPQLLLVLVSFLIISISIKKGLSPLNDLQKALLNRSEQNLNPINLPNIPEEVELVSNSVNHLMQRLKKSIASQNRFIADAAHQLRTPLAGAQAQLELAEQENSPISLKSTLPKVHLSLDRLLHTVNQLLVLAKNQPDAISTIKMESVNLNWLARAVTSDMVPTAIQKRIDLGFESNVTSAMVIGNDERLREMLYNIIDNAIRYTPTGGQVTVSISVTTTNIDLKITDNGPGINATDLDKVFDRFHRVIGSGEEGSGLGLAIVKDIVTLHNAQISVFNTENPHGLQILISFIHHKAQI